MKLAGSCVLDAPRERVWPLLYDPAVLIQLIPGCEHLEQTAPGEYRGRVVLQLPAVAGAYQTCVRLTEVDEPRRCCFAGEIAGPAGSAQGTAFFQLETAGAQTRLVYEGQGVIAGPLGSLNPRFVSGAVQSLIALGLARLNQRFRAEAATGEAAARATEVQNDSHH